jgi:segregation and condensation protein B
MKLEARIEGVLFYKSGPVEKVFLAEFFGISPEELELSLEALHRSLEMRGIRLVGTDTTVQLVTDSGLNDDIEQIRTQELQRDIGKAGAETLAIVLYRGPITRSEIDKIRGVNSTFIIRNLMIRGLIERRSNPKDSRSFLYAITPNLLQHLGIEKREDLPDFENIMDALDTFNEEARQSETQKDNNPFLS